MERFKTKMIRDIINYGKTLKEKGIFNKYCMIFFKVKNKSYWKQKYGTETVHSLGMNIYDLLLSNTDEEEIICNYFPGAYIALIKKDKLNKIINKFSKGIQNKKLGIEELLFLKIAYTFIETNNEVEDVLDNVIIGMEKIINDESKPIINYNQEIEQQISDDEKIFIVFNNSIDNNEFIPCYQPKVYSVDNSLCGAEALVRWKHNNNLILPNTFLPILESTGNISKLDLYMLERVCKDIKYWLEHGYEPVKISVNISRVNFEEKN